MSTIAYDQLRDSVAGAHVALRCRTELQPAGGEGDKVFPSTYGVDGNPAHKYAIDFPAGPDHDSAQRRRPRALLGSVASEANWHEIGLREGWELGELEFPNPFVDFSGEQGLEDLGQITSLDAPHRLADAIFRDSLLDGTLFRLSDVGRTITEARPQAATGLFQHCPTALLFGQWDSTGPKGGLGAKFERSFTSEIVGLDAEVGVRVGSRIDPLGIEKKSAVVFTHQDPGQVWTLDEEEAARDKKGKPILFDRTGASGGDKGRPSMINHGNVTPSIDRSGGVVISKAVQTTVLSFGALRKLRFPTRTDGSAIDRSDRRVAETSARTAVAALGVAAIAYRQAMGFDLRSRCVLVPTHAPQMELLDRHGGEPAVFDIDLQTAGSVLADAAAAAESVGLGWNIDEVRLVPAPKLVELVRRSRELAAESDVDED